MIAWDAPSTEVLLNPRLPTTDVDHVRRLIAAIPLHAHVWVTTSGSTGRLKPVALSKGAILASAAAVNAHLGSDARDVWINVLPAFHVGGLGIHARAHLTGATVVTLEAWEPAAFRSRLAAHAGTLSALVPAQVVDLVRAGTRAPEEVRAIIVGGGALTPDLYRRARDLGWPLLPSYGATECASQIATAMPASLADRRFPALALLPHVTARTETDGRLAIRSAALFTGYATDAGLDDPKRDGWWLTDDVGTVDGGALTIAGRVDDAVKVGGELVNLAALDARLAEVILATAPGIDAALFAAPDDRLGYVVGLAAATSDLATIDRIGDAFNTGVLPFERIRAVRLVSAIPRTALGKVRRDALRGGVDEQDGAAG